jgi:hypothetical protein
MLRAHEEPFEEEPPGEWEVLDAEAGLPLMPLAPSREPPGLRQPRDVDSATSRNAHSSCRWRASLPTFTVLFVGFIYLLVRPAGPSAHKEVPREAPESTKNVLASTQPLERHREREPLRLSVHAEPYGGVKEETRRLYGWDLILEAGREVTLRVQSPEEGALYAWRVEAVEDGRVLVDRRSGGPETTVVCPRPGTLLRIHVLEDLPPGTGRWVG